MPAHMDWGSKNARFVRDTVCAVFDWDSLCQASKAEMVGRAAAQFTAQWDLPASLVPSPFETLAFVEEYERAAGRRFSRAEWPVIIASAEYLTAQIARLEAAHASPPSGLRTGAFRTNRLKFRRNSSTSWSLPTILAARWR